MSTDSNVQTTNLHGSALASLRLFFCEKYGFKGGQATNAARSTTLEIIAVFCEDRGLGIRVFCETCAEFREECTCHLGAPDGSTKVNMGVRRWSFSKEDCATMKKLLHQQQVTLRSPVDGYVRNWLNWLDK